MKLPDKKKGVWGRDSSGLKSQIYSGLFLVKAFSHNRPSITTNLGRNGIENPIIGWIWRRKTQKMLEFGSV